MRQRTKKRTKKRVGYNPLALDKAYHLIHQPHTKHVRPKGIKRPTITKPKPPTTGAKPSNPSTPPKPVYGSAPGRVFGSNPNAPRAPTGPTGVNNKPSGANPPAKHTTGSNPNPTKRVTGSNPYATNVPRKTDSKPSGVRHYKTYPAIERFNETLHKGLWELGKRAAGAGVGAAGGYVTGGPAGILPGARAGWAIADGASSATRPAITAPPARPQITYPGYD